jgi:WD40 repeat protein
LLLVGALYAQAEAVPITAQNLSAVQSVLRLDFSLVQAAGYDTGSGIFVMNADASRLVSFAQKPGESPLSQAVLWDGRTGDLLKILPIGDNPYDRALSPEGRFLLIGRADGLWRLDIETERVTQALKTDFPLIGVWFDEKGVACGESAPDSTGQSLIYCADGRPPLPLFDGNLGEAVRIGRVPAPLSVIASPDGTVQVWSLAENRLLREGYTPDLAMFGAVNVDGAPYATLSGRFLAWRDPASQGLYRLDFTTGTNLRLGTLDGVYIAHLRLSRGGDVVFGIDPQSERGVIWAWEAETGAKRTLGAYRPCQRRQPDLATLSWDGSSLVIGCDLGLDVWRVAS